MLWTGKAVSERSGIHHLGDRISCVIGIRKIVLGYPKTVNKKINMGWRDFKFPFTLIFKFEATNVMFRNRFQLC